MAVSLLLRLRPAERLAYPIVRKAVAQSLSATSALKAFRAGGGRIANQSWFDLYRATSDIVESGSRLKYLRREARLSPSKMLPPIGSQLREFSYLVEIRGKAPRQPEESAYYMTVSSSKNLTRGEIEDHVLSLLRRKYRDDTTAYRPVWVQATHSPIG